MSAEFRELRVPDDLPRETRFDLPPSGAAPGAPRPGPPARPGVPGIIRALVTRGTTVMLTTQYLDEADQLADRIAVVAIPATGLSGPTGGHRSTREKSGGYS